MQIYPCGTVYLSFFKRHGFHPKITQSGQVKPLKNPRQTPLELFALLLLFGLPLVFTLLKLLLLLTLGERSHQ